MGILNEAMHYMFFPLVGLFGLVWLAVPVAVVVLIVWAVTRPRQPYLQAPPAPPIETPLDILARRFASGEISADDYQKARDLLQEGRPKST